MSNSTRSPKPCQQVSANSEISLLSDNFGDSGDSRHTALLAIHLGTEAFLARFDLLCAENFAFQERRPDLPPLRGLSEGEAVRRNRTFEAALAEQGGRP